MPTDQGEGRPDVPPRKKTPSGPIPIDVIQHPDKRLNIPTADAQEWVPDEHRQVPTVVYERDPSLDPQLVWRGKYDRDVTELVADAPPIYIQEKIDARVLVENLRETATAGEPEPEATLFDTFDGLDDLDSVDFYQHQANWSNRMILGDSLQVMASLAEREALRGKVQMIYIDPPYGIKFGSNWQASARKRDVKDGKDSDAAREAEQIKAFRDTWELGIHSYLSYLRDRLMVARDLLTESGSVFVQIGDENSHLVRSLLDEVFGSANFINQIAFTKTTSQTSEFIPATYDYIIWYGKDRDATKYRPLFLQKEPSAMYGTYRKVETDDGKIRNLSSGERKSGVIDGKLLALGDMVSQSGSVATQGEFIWQGDVYRPRSGGWKTNQAGLRRLAYANRLANAGTTLLYRRYFADFPVSGLGNYWIDTQLGGYLKGEEKYYVVQTAALAIERCVLMSTDPGDLVIDPTCGSGTTAHVAEQWGRRWITIDTSRVALALARQRLMGARYPYYLLADSQAGRVKAQEIAGRPTSATKLSHDIRNGFVYERVQHITLRSIVNNPDIHEGMSRQEIEAAIGRHADFEYLYDRPYEDKRRVRVSGPFTVESLSPHRALAFEQSGQSGGEVAADRGADAQTFEQTILENLAKSGIQTGTKSERIEFATFDRFPGLHVQAVGERRAAVDEPDAAPSRVAIAIGPQYGTVSQEFIKDAAREALRAEGIDLLCVLGFAFDPQAMGVSDDGVTLETEDGFTHVAERSIGKVQVLFVRMNVDLLMGEALKKTKAANLFTVFGEPDIELHRVEDDRLTVELHGVDVYDPTTGEVRSDNADKIALWMVDTDYNGESFFVRHCYFTGGNDPLKRLKTALKAEIDADAWATMYGTVSRPFDKPASGQIAVKVINDYGDEVMKVFDVS
ncbi:site-specific DNA-methyltransferase [Pseudactinotalea sp. HY158]|uniref:site-specific DNA-methyltransferase n=1 Tax=Pseudactinotalea sp. HY158 TaxID=2654547 RepID=UPI001E285F0C|nr:site-specific DNA-methyltransferase [Pseudactinotalea sp. HY158]